MSEKAPAVPQIPEGLMSTESPEGDLMHIEQKGDEIIATTYKNDFRSNETTVSASSGEVLDEHDYMEPRSFRDPEGNFVVAKEVDRNVVETMTHLVPEDPEVAAIIEGRVHAQINKQTGEVISEGGYPIHVL